MKRRRLIAFVLAAVMLLPLSAFAAEQEQALWTRIEGDGSYVTIRVPYPDGIGLRWSEHRNLHVRYADTEQPIALCSEFRDGFIFVTVPQNQAGRPLEVFKGEPLEFADCYVSWESSGKKDVFYDAPLGTDLLNIRGVIRGDDRGHLNPDQVITRAEAFTIILRLMGIPLDGEIWTDWYYVNGGYSGFKDVDRMTDWFYETAAAAKVYGITNEPEYFRPQDKVTRAEFTVMLARAMRKIGWLHSSGDEPLDAMDADRIPQWAGQEYRDLAAYRVGIRTYRDTEEIDEFGAPVQSEWVEHDKAATRGEVIEMVYDALRFLPVYPTQTAIDWGFDREMPVIDGSTSTLPYTNAVYGAFYYNYYNHPAYPEKHSKSYYSYERLISGEADMLFIAAKPTQDTIDKAKAAGVELEFIPIAHDAMVFFTNGENTADDLTMEQIRSIYVDNACANWSELGGPDAALIPYCRNADSGSQALMEEFFLEGGDIHPDIRRETTSVSMASVLTDVWQAKTDPPPAYALGYSIYYYYQNASWILLPSMDTLKLLSVDGVYPTDQTIADRSYPLAGYNYIAIRADARSDSPARRMADFMLSERGQQCVVNAGFGALT